jgi:hypothetical protein
MQKLRPACAILSGELIPCLIAFVFVVSLLAHPTLKKNKAKKKVKGRVLE